MQPAAAEIERVSGCIGDGPSAAAEPRPRLDHEASDGGIVQPPRGGEAGRAAADDRDLDVIVRPADTRDGYLWSW